MSPRPILSPERKNVIQKEVVAWYKGLDAKTEGCEALGFSIDAVSKWIKGTNSPPPTALKTLYIATQNDVFLLSSKEKATYRHWQRDVPDSNQWPDSDAKKSDQSAATPPTRPNGVPNGEKLSVAEIKQMGKNFLYQIQRLADLPSNDPVREEARKRLTELGARLLYEFTKLKLQYPEAFADLLGPMEIALSVFGNDSEQREE